MRALEKDLLKLLNDNISLYDKTTRPNYITVCSNETISNVTVSTYAPTVDTFFDNVNWKGNYNVIGRLNMCYNGLKRKPYVYEICYDENKYLSIMDWINNISSYRIKLINIK